MNLAALGAALADLGSITAEVRAVPLPGAVRVSASKALEGGGAGFLGKMLRPSIIVRAGDGTELAHVEPYGPPPGWSGYVLIVGVPLALVAVGFFLGLAAA